MGHTRKTTTALLNRLVAAINTAQESGETIRPNKIMERMGERGKSWNRLLTLLHEEKRVKILKRGKLPQIIILPHQANVDAIEAAKAAPEPTPLESAIQQAPEIAPEPDEVPTFSRDTLPSFTTEELRNELTSRGYSVTLTAHPVGSAG